MFVSPRLRPTYSHMKIGYVVSDKVSRSAEVGPWAIRSEFPEVSNKAMDNLWIIYE